MITELSSDYPLRGYAFEYISRILLRQKRNHNFIFQASRFDNIEEIISKYRLIINNKFKKISEFISKNWNKFDLIEFELSNKESRIVENIFMYDVKTKFHKRKIDYYEMCHSNYEFAKEIKSLFDISIYIISIIIYENWRFSFNMIDFTKVKIKPYTRFRKK